MIMMMTDPDRVALSAFLPCISVSFHSPIHANFNAHLPQECPPLQFVTHLITPSILVFGFTSQQICLFSSHFSSTFWHVCQALHHFSRLLLLFFAQHLSAGLLPFSPLAIKQPTITEKNLQSKSHPVLLSASQHAYTHLRSIIYVSITPGGIYLAPKRRIC